MIISLYHPVCNAQAQENHALWIDMPVRCMIVTRRLRLLASCKALRPFRAYLHVGPRCFVSQRRPKRAKCISQQYLVLQESDWQLVRARAKRPRKAQLPSDVKQLLQMPRSAFLYSYMAQHHPFIENIYQCA